MAILRSWLGRVKYGQLSLYRSGQWLFRRDLTKKNKKSVFHFTKGSRKKERFGSVLQILWNYLLQINLWSFRSLRKDISSHRLKKRGNQISDIILFIIIDTVCHRVIWFVSGYISKIGNIHFIWKIKARTLVSFRAFWFALSWFPLAGGAAGWARETGSRWVYPALHLCAPAWALTGVWADMDLQEPLLLCSISCAVSFPQALEVWSSQVSNTLQMQNLSRTEAIPR